MNETLALLIEALALASEAAKQFQPALLGPSSGRACHSSRADLFADGNRHGGFLVAIVFLGLNGFRLHASIEDVVVMICRLAAAELPWGDLLAWYEANTSRPS